MDEAPEQGQEDIADDWPGPEPTQDQLLQLARRGAEAWNTWRARYPAEKSGFLEYSGPRADFSSVDLTTDGGSGIDFSGFEFGAGARFEGANLGREAQFIGATFGENASFAGATLGYGSRFDGAIFGNLAAFNAASFGDLVRFDGAVFGTWCRFDGASFGDLASFGDTTFHERLLFSNATFGDGARFDGATFDMFTRFDGATFGDGANFKGVALDTWTKRVCSLAELLPNSTRNDYLELREKDRQEGRAQPDSFADVDFSGARLRGAASFVGRRFTASADFSGVRFGLPPDFSNTKKPGQLGLDRYADRPCTIRLRPAHIWMDDPHRDGRGAAPAAQNRSRDLR